MSKVKKTQGPPKGKEHWMQKAFSEHEGSLHRMLNVPEGETIPMNKLLHAAQSDNLKLKRKAIAALNAIKSSRDTR